MSSTSDERQLILQARQALQDGRWAEARKLYAQIPPDVLDPAEVEAARRKIERLEQDERQLILQARQTLQDGRWAEARDLYAQVPPGVLDPVEVEAARRKIERLEQADADVQELIKQADAHFEVGAYREAHNTYTMALNQAGAAGVLKYHARIEQRRYLARDLADWQDKVNRAVVAAQNFGKAGQWEQALERLKRLLDEMPQGEAHAPLIVNLNKQREEVEKQIGADLLYKKALAAYQAQDWEEARKLAEAVPPTSARYRDAQVLIGKIDEFMERYIQPAVNNIKAAFDEQRWPDAFSELENLRSQFPQSRICQQWWLQVGKACGLRELDAGREANSQRDFKGAQRAFQSAATTFQKVLELHPTHSEIQALRTEAQDLAQIAIAEAQAQADWDADRYAEATEALKGALQRIEFALSEGRDYAAVAAAVRSTHAALLAEMGRIEDEKLRLQTGERHLDQLRLEEARAVFAGLLNAVLPADRAIAQERLDRAEAEIRGFTETMTRAGTLQDLEQVAVAYEDAFARWPGGQGARDGLLDAADRLLAANLPVPALRCVERVLEVDPHNERALAIKQKPGVAAQVQAGIESANRTIDRINGDLDAAAADYTPVQESLARLVEQAKSYPDLQRQLAQTVERANATYERRRAFEANAAGAEQQRRAGHWDRAAAGLAEALAKFGDEAPPALGARLAQWRAAADKTALALREGRDALLRARQAYDKVPQTHEVGVVTDPLQNALQLVQDAEAACQAAGGPIPDPVTSLHRDIDGLKRRADLVNAALTSSSARDGLTSVKQQLAQHGSDATLEAIAKDLQEKLLQEVPDLLRRAQDAADQGFLTDALDLYHEARQLKPEDQAIGKAWSDLARRKDLEEQLRQIEQDSGDKLRDRSPSEAANALRRGIQRLLNPEVGLSVEISEIIQEVLALALQDDGLALAREETRSKARNLVAELGKRSRESWTAYRSYQLTEDWLNIATDNALYAQKESSKKLEDYVEAYRAAAMILTRNSQDDAAITEEADLRVKVAKGMCDSASKRIEWAKTQLQEGNWRGAQVELENIERKFYAPVRAVNSKILDIPEAVAQQGQIEELQLRVSAQQQLEDRVVPQFSAAESAWQQNRLDDAEAALETLPALTDAPWWEKRRNDIASRISRAKAKNVLRTFKDKLAEIEVAVEDAQTVEALQAADKKLKALIPPVGDQEALEARERYVNAVTTVTSRLSKLADATTFEALATAAEQRGDYVAAGQALQKASDAAFDPVKKAALRAHHEELQGAAERQQDREAAENAGRTKFRQRQYGEAREKLRLAKDLGAEVDTLLEAVWVGELVSDAQRMWDEKKDVLAVQSLLQHALEQGKDKQQATEIVREAEALRFQVERFQADRTVLAASMLGEAQTALEAGQHSAALARVNAILTNVLPGWPAAVALREQIERLQKSYQTLLQAENAAKAYDFQQARELLDKAIQLEADPAAVREMRATIEAAEKDWQQNTIIPIREKIEGGKYADALILCDEAANKTLSPDFQTALNDLRMRAVRESVTAELANVRTDIAKASSEALEGIIERLARLTNLKPQDSLQRQITDLTRNANERLLSAQLDMARQQMTASAWDFALQTATEVKKQADGLSLGRLSWEADALALQIETQQRDSLDQQNREQYQKLYDEAATLQKNATGRAELELAASRLRKALEVSGYADDWAAKTKLVDVESALRVFDDTAQALRQSREALFQRRTRDAETALTRLTRVAPLLSADYDRQRGLLRSLRQAENAQESGEYALALDSYRAAVRQDPAVEPLLETAMDRCRERLMERQTAQVRDALELTLPDVSRAETLLDQAVKQDWVTPTSQSTVNRLRNWVASYKHLAKAVGDLSVENVDADQILQTLRQARASLPEGQSDATLVQWEQLAQALRDWEAGDIDNARLCLNGVLPPATEHQRARRLADDIARASANRQAIEQGRLRVESAFSATPPRYDAAVEAAVAAMRETNGAPAIISVRNMVAQRLQSALESAQNQLHYGEAIRLANLLVQLGADSPAAKVQVESLCSERDQKRAEAMSGAETALNADRLDEAEGKLEQAEVIGGEAGRDLNALRKRLEHRRGAFAEADGHLRSAQAALGALDWEGALQAINRARTSSPDYPSVADAVTEAQARMMAAAQTQLRDYKFDKAGQLCDVAIRLGANSSLDELRDLIQRERADRSAAQEQQRMNQFAAQEQRRMNQFAEWRKQAEAALAVWDVDNADRFIEQANKVAPEHADVPRLRAQRQRLAEAGQPVKQAMERGREALLKQDYGAAIAAFDEALTRVPDFREGIQWRIYATQLRLGVETMLATEGGSVAQALNDLQTAEAALRIGPQDQLPAILPDVREWRRQSVYVAHCLAEAGAELVRREQAYADALKGRDLKRRVQLLDAVEAQQQAFAQIHSNPRIAPVDFSVERGAQEVAAPAVTSRPTGTVPDGREAAHKPLPSPAPTASEPAPLWPAIPTSAPAASGTPEAKAANSASSESVAAETIRPAGRAGPPPPARDSASVAPPRARPDPAPAPAERPTPREDGRSQEAPLVPPPGATPADRSSRRAADGGLTGLSGQVPPEQRPPAAASEAEMPARMPERSPVPANGPADQQPAQVPARSETSTSTPESSAPADEAEAAFLKRRNWGRSRLTPTSTDEESQR